MSDKTEKQIMDALAEPFAGPVVKWRPQGNGWKKNGRFYARAVAYVDARIVIDRFNDVLGFGWQKRTTETAKGRVICAIGITLPCGREVWRDDGAGDTDIQGEKGAISDALKRAAVNFGVGAYLYALPTPIIEIEGYEGKDKRGRDVVIPTGITRESRDKLAELAQRSLTQWEAHLNSMNAGADEEGAEAPSPAEREAETDTRKAKESSEPKVRGDGKGSRAKGESGKADAAKLKDFSDRALAAIENADSEATLAELEGQVTGHALFSALDNESVTGIKRAIVSRRAALIADEVGLKPAGGKAKPAPREKADANGVRRVPPPTINDKAGWRDFGQRFAAAIKAEPSFAAAEKLIEAHANALEVLSSFASMDGAEWARGLAKKHHANRDQGTGGRAR